MASYRIQTSDTIHPLSAVYLPITDHGFEVGRWSRLLVRYNFKILVREIPTPVLRAGRGGVGKTIIDTCLSGHGFRVRVDSRHEKATPAGLISPQ